MEKQKCIKIEGAATIGTWKEDANEKKWKDKEDIQRVCLKRMINDMDSNGKTCYILTQHIKRKRTKNREFYNSGVTTQP